MQNKVPILFTFRRCPYAIRARLALAIAGIDYQTIEVDLKNKPEQLLFLSAKGTVPVFMLNDGRVLEQSLDIMYWALHQSNTHKVLLNDKSYASFSQRLIEQNDTEFKRAIDCYKYPNKYSSDAVANAKICAEMILKQWDVLLNNQSFLYGESISLVDYALIPFVRQFAGVDKAYFCELSIPNIHVWLAKISDSDLFKQIMRKV